MAISQIKGTQIQDGTITSADIDDGLEKDFTKVSVTTGDSSPNFLSSKIVAGDNITISVIGSSGSTQYLAISSSTGGGGSSAPVGAQYVTLATDSTLTSERVLTAGNGLTLTDTGAGGNATLAINNSVVATVSGTQFTGNVGVTGSLGTTSLTVVSGALYHANGVFKQNSAFRFDEVRQALVLGGNPLQPSVGLQVAGTPSIRIGSITSYLNISHAGGSIYRFQQDGTSPRIECLTNFVTNTNTFGFVDSLTGDVTAGFKRAGTGIIQVSGSAPGAVLRFNASSTSLSAGDFGMNTTTGRPNALIGGSVRELAHTAEIAPVGSSYVVTSADSTLTNERVLTAGSGISITDGGAGGNITISASGGSGALTLVETKTLTTTGSVTFTGLNGDTDKTYFLEGEVTVSSGANIEIHPNGNGGTVMIGSYITNTSGASTPAGGTLTKLSMPAGSSVSSGERLRFTTEILADSRGSTYAPLFQTHCMNDATGGGGAIRQQTISNAFTSRSAITSLKVSSTGGNMTGRVSLFKRTP